MLIEITDDIYLSEECIRSIRSMIVKEYYGLYKLYFINKDDNILQIMNLEDPKDIKIIVKRINNYFSSKL